MRTTTAKIPVRRDRIAIILLLLLSLAIATAVGGRYAVGGDSSHPDPSRAPVVPANTTMFGFLVDSLEHDGVVYLEIDPAQLLPADETMPDAEGGLLLVNDSDETILLPMRSGHAVPEYGLAYWIDLEAGMVTRVAIQDVADADLAGKQE